MQLSALIIRRKAVVLYNKHNVDDSFISMYHTLMM